MPRHTLKPLPRGIQLPRAGPSGIRYGQDMMDWSRLDRVQVLGTGRAQDGHTGCVNALSWSDDGDILLSGSDDKRVCIWTPDTSSIATSSTSPHPLKLSTTIHTGHGANIFSAKFLPNAGTPTVVSVAGDHEIRLIEIERLGQSSGPIVEDNGGHRADLWAQGGPGVKVLKCHRDRTKRIATENSPFLFLTVSEDGTVRQHDLRRPHRCRDECPDPLFRAPQGVDLYSLSVSTPAPHIFAVAGRTDAAFVCDRRMLERHNPNWGNKVVGSGQVHCVRRLGLPDSEWESVQPTGAERMFTGDRHITCVKMSPEHADEAIVAFQRQSTSLFSIYDSPGTSSAKRSPSPIVPPGERTRAHLASVDPTVTPAKPRPISIKEPALGKRKKSAETISRKNSAPESSKQRLGSGSESSLGRDEETPRAADFETEEASRDSSSSISPSVETTSHSEPSGSATIDNPDLIQDLLEEDLRDLMNLDEDIEDEENVPNVWLEDLLQGANEDRDQEEDLPFTIAADGNIDSIGPILERSTTQDDDEREELFDHGDQTGHIVDDPYADDWEDYEDYDDYDDDDGGGGHGYGGGDYDGFDEDYGYDDYDDEYDDEDDDEDEDVVSHYPDRRSADTEFGEVEMILPRRMFRGAKNIETVKDCNFLGLRSDKVCSGSDDGHFFVWDKNTGRLEGIWEGDSSVVNVMEQHPSLPIVAVSGIDDTIKMFAATLHDPEVSFSRTHLKDTIIKANTDRERMHMGSTLDRLSLLQLFANRTMVVPTRDDEEDEGGPTRPTCETQ